MIDVLDAISTFVMTCITTPFIIAWNAISTLLGMIGTSIYFIVTGIMSLFS